MEFTPQTLRFIREHQKDDVRLLALQTHKYKEIDLPAAISQIAGRQTAAIKFPSWHVVEGLIYPSHLSLEQCSSEATARYKASFLQGDSFVDLTGGFGIDCAFIAANFKQATYVERQKELCEIARHNFPLLGLSHIDVVNGDAREYLERMKPVSCIFIDPARRNKYGNKTVAISDCEPDIKECVRLLTEKARTVAIKLSPMLDISLAIKELPYVKEVHIVSVSNECKEVFLIGGAERSARIPFHCVNLTGEGWQTFVFTREEEQEAMCEYAVLPAKYIYEPNVSILKAGAYKTVTLAYQVGKLHPNSHLYTSDTLVPGFPGRVFRCESVLTFNKTELKEQLQGIDRANITVRNFPATVEEIRKKIKIKEGGECYLFATTLYDGKKVLLKCFKEEAAKMF